MCRSSSPRLVVASMIFLTSFHASPDLPAAGLSPVGPKHALVLPAGRAGGTLQQVGARNESAEPLAWRWLCSYRRGAPPPASLAWSTDRLPSRRLQGLCRAAAHVRCLCLQHGGLRVPQPAAAAGAAAALGPRGRRAGLRARLAVASRPGQAGPPRIPLCQARLHPALPVSERPAPCMALCEPGTRRRPTLLPATLPLAHLPTSPLPDPPPVPSPHPPSPRPPTAVCSITQASTGAGWVRAVRLSGRRALLSQTCLIPLTSSCCSQLCAVGGQFARVVRLPGGWLPRLPDPCLSLQHSPVDAQADSPAPRATPVSPQPSQTRISAARNAEPAPALCRPRPRRRAPWRSCSTAHPPPS